jgi:hypothetical protein
MNHKISEFCDKVDSLKKMADDLRVLKYKTPKSMTEIESTKFN